MELQTLQAKSYEENQGDAENKILRPPVLPLHGLLFGFCFIICHNY